MTPREAQERTHSDVRRQSGHFSSEATLCTSFSPFLGVTCTCSGHKTNQHASVQPRLTRIVPHLLGSTWLCKLQNSNSKHQRNSKLQSSTGHEQVSGLELVIWCFSGACSLEFGALRMVRIPTGHPVPCPLLSHPQVLENPRTATFPVLMSYSLPHEKLQTFALPSFMLYPPPLT